MGMFSFWLLGHEIVLEALNIVEQKNTPPSKLYRLLDVVAAELRSQFQAKVPFECRREIKVIEWKPWRAVEGVDIGEGWDLEMTCNSLLKYPRKVNYEAIDQWKLANDEWLSSLEREFDPALTANEVAILDEMLKLKATADSPRSAKVILVSLKWAIEGKHVFDNLKELGYVAAKKGPGGGYYLTKSGSDRASRMKLLANETIGAHLLRTDT